MKTSRRISGYLLFSGSIALAARLWLGCGYSSNGDATTVGDAGLQANARQRDPAWAPSYQEVGVIRVAEKGKGGGLHNFWVNLDGNLLACCGMSPATDGGPSPAGQPRAARLSEPPAVRVFSPEGKLLQSWPMETQPQAICVYRDGTIYVGGDGRILKLDQKGKILAAVDSPA